MGIRLIDRLVANGTLTEADAAKVYTRTLASVADDLANRAVEMRGADQKEEPMSSQADLFRKRATEMRELGSRAPTAAIQASFEDVAVEYDRLGRQSEKEALRRKTLTTTYPKQP